MNNLIASFQSLTSTCPNDFNKMRPNRWRSSADGGRGGVGGRGGERGRDVRGEEEPGEAAEARRLTAQENGRVFDVTGRQWQQGRAASLRDQEGWRVNYYTCSQYLTGLTPCPSVLHPDSTEGRAKNMTIVSSHKICIQGITSRNLNVINNALESLFPL